MVGTCLALHFRGSGWVRKCVLVCPLACEPAAACVALGEVLCCAPARSLAGKVVVPRSHNWLQAQPRKGLRRLEFAAA